MTNTTILTELFEKDYISTEVKLTEDYEPILLRTLSYELQAKVEEILKQNTENLSNRQFIQLATITVLSHTLLSWGSLKGISPTEWVEFLQKKPLAVIQKLSEEQHDLETLLKKTLKVKGAVKEAFFEGEELPGESKQ